MGTVVDLYQGWVDFATESGTVNDGTSRLLLGGGALVAALAIFALYNAVLATVNGIHRTGRVLARVARPVTDRVSAAAPWAVPVQVPVQVSSTREAVKVG